MTEEIETRKTAAIGDNSGPDRAHKLFDHILALERLQEAKDEAGQDFNARKNIAKADGFDTNVMAAILKRRKNGSGQTQAFDELLAEYETKIQQARETALPTMTVSVSSPGEPDAEPEREQEPDPPKDMF